MSRWRSKHGKAQIDPFFPTWINSSTPGQNGCYFADDIFTCIFVNENAWNSLEFSLKFVPRINNIPVLMPTMAYRLVWSNADPVHRRIYAALREDKLIWITTSIITCKINSLWPSNAIYWHRSGSTLAQVMACCLTAPSHYLNQC